MFSSLKNLSSSAVIVIDNPVEVSKKLILPKNLTTKDQYRKYCTNPKTTHSFISLIAGNSPTTRINSDNEPRTMSGVIADYDTPLSDEEVEACMSEYKGDYYPNYIHDTFSSGKHRLVWLFEKPILVAGKKHASELLKILNKKLKLMRLMPGFDEQGLRPEQYFEIGTNWEPVCLDPIPHSIVLAWVAQASQNIKISAPSAQPTMNLEQIAELVEDNYPGRWNGPFILGARGVRFWDSDADCETSAVVTETGMICHTGMHAFRSWLDIFGSKTLDEAFGSSVGALRDELYYDGRGYYMLDGDGGYRAYSKDDMSHHLYVACGLSRTRKKGLPSDLDKFENDIRMNRRVDLAMPFVYRQPGPINYLGKRYLNILKTKFALPGPPIALPEDQEYTFENVGRNYFPFIHSFLSEAFAPPPKRLKWMPEWVDNPAPYILLAWLSRIYKGAVAYNPVRAQALLLAGMQGVGKTFAIEGVISRVLGPTADATNHLVDGSEWTDALVSSPLLVVDDSMASSTDAGLKRTTSIIKKLTANKSLFYNQKYGSAGKAEWFGNVIIACNTDFESIRILPDMEMATKDKFILLQMQPGIPLPGQDKQEKYVTQELPYFTRFLADWKIPDWTLAPAGSSIRNRFGIRNYHHAELFEAAVSGGAPNTVLECLLDLYESLQQSTEALPAALNGVKMSTLPDQKGWVWRGRGNNLYKELYSYLGPSIMGRIPPGQLVRGLGVLHSRGYPIKKINKTWEIEFSDNLYGEHLQDLDSEGVE